ncbi:MAG TPA: ABC transporter ATP-binding protein [Thermoanaerobaculia bacterium]|nr:ABC transporter ATP-binding protein [Thermoanaerobaculia bacterium]
MRDLAVSVENLSKTYKVYGNPWDRVRELVTRRPHHREFRALRDVSFSLPHGEGLAIVGENGAGKSTLLKILAGITPPTSGTLSVQGKIASILELGSGFHPEFTGRQNVVLNAAMLGLSEEEVQRKMPDILAFSELGDFIDQPVKCYSTGMAMRLGFSIATQVEPEVLIIDEALSVGDGYFQKKCMDRLRVFVESGGTLLFCSHAMYYVSAFCQRALWLKGGRPEALGPVSQVVREYENFLVAKSASASEAAPAAEERAGRPARITGARLLGDGTLYSHGEPLELEISWETTDPSLAFHVGVGVNRTDEVEVCAFASHLDGLPPRTGERSYTARLRIPALPLLKGEFKIYVFLLDEEGLHIYDQRILARAFSVQSPSYVFGLVHVDHAWDWDAADRSSVQLFVARGK